MRVGVNGRFLGARRGGVQRFALQVLLGLGRREEVVLLLPRGGRPPDDLPASVRVVGGVLPGHAWEQLELPVAARRAGADVVVHPANAAPLWGGPNVVVLHDLGPLSEPSAFRLRYRVWCRLAHAGAARRASAVVTVSRWSAREIARILDLPADRITVARQGTAPLDRPATSDEVCAVRRRYGLDGRYFLAATAGDPRKGEAFLRALWQTWPDPPAPALVLVGHRSDALHVHSPRGDDGAGIRAVGFVPDEDLRALFTGSIALLYPSRFEGFGRPPLEALACGTRVVAAPYGPAAEVLDGAGDLVQADPDAWRGALRRLLDEPAEVRARRIRRGRELAASFTWDEAVDRLLEACLRAASEGV